MTTELDQEMLADLAYLNLLQEMREATESSNSALSEAERRYDSCNSEPVELEMIWPSE